MDYYLEHLFTDSSGLALIDSLVEHAAGRKHRQVSLIPFEHGFIMLRDAWDIINILARKERFVVSKYWCFKHRKRCPVSQLTFTLA